jgi:hypothetical protein
MLPEVPVSVSSHVPPVLFDTVTLMELVAVPPWLSVALALMV